MKTLASIKLLIENGELHREDADALVKMVEDARIAMARIQTVSDRNNRSFASVAVLENCLDTVNIVANDYQNKRG